MDNTYKIKYKCDNCSLVQDLEFPKGTKVTSIYAPCTYCGCDVLEFIGRVESNLEEMTK